MTDAEGRYTFPMTTLEARIENGKVVLTPEQAAELGLREGEVLPVTIAPRSAEGKFRS